jgi:ribosome-associated protein
MGLALHDGRVIPQRELRFRASRASGPGGQHVNKTSSRVELVWDLARSTVITDRERATLGSALANRLDADGSVVVVASDTRSQFRNRSLAESRLAALVRRALTPRPRRIPTKPTAAQKARRLESKRRHSTRKSTRRPQDFE